MKRIFKKEVIIAFIMGVVLTASIAVYAETSAREISYKRTGTEIKNVEEALNDLYSNANHINKVTVAEGITLSTTTSYEYDISKITDKYKDFTVDNFTYTCEFYHSVPSYPGVNRNETITLTYDNTNGKLTVTGTSLCAPGYYFLYFCNVNIYLIY